MSVSDRKLSDFLPYEVGDDLIIKKFVGDWGADKTAQAIEELEPCVERKIQALRAVVDDEQTHLKGGFTRKISERYGFYPDSTGEYMPIENENVLAVTTSYQEGVERAIVAILRSRQVYGGAPLDVGSLFGKLGEKIKKEAEGETCYYYVVQKCFSKEDEKRDV